MVLPRTQRLRIHRSRTAVADCCSWWDCSSGSRSWCGRSAPRSSRPGEQRPLLTLFLIASIAIASVLRGGAGLWPSNQPGDGRVLALVGCAPLGRRLLRSVRDGGHRFSVRPAEVGANEGCGRRRAFSSATIFLSGGIIGTLHHLYFSAAHRLWSLGLGSVFSALEVVPLLFVGFEAWENLRLSIAPAVGAEYRWPIYFLTPCGPGHSGKFSPPPRKIPPSNLTGPVI